MPSEFGPDTARGGLRITVAPVIDFHFSLFLLTKSCRHPERWVPGWVTAAASENPDTMDLFDRFWRERGLDQAEPGTPYLEWGESLVCAWRTGTLFAPSVEDFLDALPGVLARDYGRPELLSEPPHIEDLVDRRLALLRADAESRGLYVEMLRRLWAIVAPAWERTGRADAERAADDLATRARPDADLRTLVPGNNFVHKDSYQRQIYTARERGELVIVPLGLGGAGQLYWSFPGVVIIGAGLDSAEREARRRERSERAANRLKVLSDPTRVAILVELLRPSHHALTVTELASQFRLSQPTVSVHMKMLREAGLVDSEREGNQVRYKAEEATVRSYIEGALSDLFNDDRSRYETPEPALARR